MWINGVMVIDNMDVINKDYFSNLIFSSRKDAFIDTTLFSRIFEQIPHDLTDLDDVEFTLYNAEIEIKQVNNYTDLALGDSSKDMEDTYFVAVSSGLYDFFLNKMKIPTKEEVGEKFTLKKCSISLKNQADENETYQALTMLSFLKIPLNKPVAIIDTIFNEMLNHFSSVLDFEILSDLTLFGKNVVLSTFESEYDILSPTTQVDFKQSINSILKYKALNPKTNSDNSRLDNLQYYMIEQQIRMHLYSIFRKVILKNFVKINDPNSLFEFTGNLFFSISTPCDTFKTNEYFNFQQISEYVIDRGIFVSYLDAQNKVYFGESKQDSSEKTTFDRISIDQNETNPIYTLLFRLCDKRFSPQESVIDELISSRKYSELEDLLTELLYSNYFL